MTDLTKTTEPKSDQLNYDDIPDNATKTIKVTKVNLCSGDMPVAINYEGDNGKPYKPCKSMRRVLVKVWGSDGNKYIGQSMTLFGDPTVVFGGQKVGGIRISHMSGIKEPVTMSLTATRAKRQPYTVKPLVVADNSELIAQGNDVAKLGVEEYTKWKDSLDANKKQSIKHMHAEWSAIAKKADESKQEPEITTTNEWETM